MAELGTCLTRTMDGNARIARNVHMYVVVVVVVACGVAVFFCLFLLLFSMHP